MFDRASVRLAAALLVVGEVLFIVVGLFHPAHEDPNKHRAAFAEYAHSNNWTAVHLGQFIATAVLLAGVLVLLVALNARTTPLRWTTRFAATAAAATLALYAVLQAVDGVALKNAVDSWAHASPANRASAFADAEVVRWLEWGVRSYAQLMLGATLVLLGIVIVATRRIPKTVGYLAALTGVAYAVQGIVIGSEGFSADADHPGFTALILQLIWIAWFAVIASRMKRSAACAQESVTIDAVSLSI